MRLTRSFLSSDRGFTLIELLVVTLLGMLVTGMALSFTTLHRNVLGQDVAQTRLTQNLRGSLDIMGADIRVAGENLPSIFPAVELTDGGAASDSLYLRRNLLDEILPVCKTVTGGPTKVYFAVVGNVAGCAYSGQTTSYNSWHNYRISKGGTVPAYIYDTVSRVGQFISVTGETNTGTEYYITAGSGIPGTYNVGSASVYMLEEWLFQRNAPNKQLQVVQNNQTAQAQNVSFGITDFQTRIIMQDNSIQTSFPKGSQWSQIKSIEVTLNGTDSFRKQAINKVLVGKFFPRNVLSN